MAAQQRELQRLHAQVCHWQCRVDAKQVWRKGHGGVTEGAWAGIPNRTQWLTMWAGAVAREGACGECVEAQ